jgi:hypothetical protein
MVVYVGKEISATVAGRRLESVTCEQCGSRFHYELTRVGVGKASAPFFLLQGSASDRAGAAAQRDLTKRLSREAELVPCPKCFWVNQDLVDRYRRRLYRRAPLLIVILVIAGFVAAPVAGVGLTATFGYESRAPGRVMWAVLAVCILSPLWVLFVRRQLRRRTDPNRTYPRRPVVPPGTPPALVERPDPQTGEVFLEPVASQADAPSGPGEWAVFRPGQIQLPPYCCTCLAPASTTYRPPFKVNQDSDVEVPLCDPCLAQLRRRWWLVLLAVAACSLALAAVTATAVPGIDSFGRWFIFGVLGFFGALVGGVVIAGLTCKPYRMAVVDGDRGVVKFAARNPGYTAMLVDQVRQSDGIAVR